MKHKMMLIYVDETESFQGIPLYEAIMRLLLKLAIRGASAHIGTMGFGSHRRVHRKGLFGISDDRPVMISVVDEEEKLRSAIPEIRRLGPHHTIVLLDAELA